MKLQNKLIILICSVILLVIFILAVLFQHMLSVTLKEQIGMRALHVAEAVAEIPDIISAFSTPEPWKIIQPIVEEIRSKTGAEYIVVGNHEGIRYSHPIPERIGKEMVGGDNGPVLAGRAIISEAVGSLGPAIRGKVPIFDEKGNVIGIVSVGFLMEDIRKIIADYGKKIIWMGVLTLMIGAFGAILIARNVKKSIWGLEPAEIGALYQEKQAILESIIEGIIAVDAEGSITMMNQTAMRILDIPLDAKIAGLPILELIPNSRLMEVLKTGKSEYDQEILVNDQILIANRIPIFDHERHVIGAVASFRNKSELYRITQELSQVKRYADALRAQTHEYSNKLYVISGLLQLESYQEAIELISKESDTQQNLIRFIMKEIPDPFIGGLLVGKFNRASELKVELVIDSESSFKDIPEHIDREYLITIIGNLIDNAMEAVLPAEIKNKKVIVFLTDLGEELIIEVEDNGVGIPDSIADKIFELGFSTKEQDNRGIGLALVKRAIQRLNGQITYSSHSNKGTLFTVAIPKLKVSS